MVRGITFNALGKCISVAYTRFAYTCKAPFSRIHHLVVQEDDCDDNCDESVDELLLPESGKERKPSIVGKPSMESTIFDQPIAVFRIKIKYKAKDYRSPIKYA